MAMETPGLQFVRSLAYCRELIGAVERFCTSNTLEHVKAAIEFGANNEVRLQTLDDGSVPTDCDAQVARLVLKEFDTPNFTFTVDPTPSGKETLAYLQRVIFKDATDYFMHCVYMGSIFQARLAQDMCIATLMDVLSTSNCISLFSLAASCGCEVLYEAAYHLTLDKFSEASVNDYEGLGNLTEEVFMKFLLTDELNVDCELDVFKALASWVEYDLPSRIVKFARRMALAVRFSQLSVADMTYMMDHHPLVSLDNEAVEIVTYAILQTYMGTGFDNGLGRPTNNKPRLCQEKNNNNQLPLDPLPTAASHIATPQSCFAATLRSLFPAVAPALVSETISSSLISVAGKENAAAGDAIIFYPSPAVAKKTRVTLSTNNTTNITTSKSKGASMSGLALEMLVSPGKKQVNDPKPWDVFPQTAPSHPHQHDNDGATSPRDALPSQRKLCW